MSVSKCDLLIVGAGPAGMAAAHAARRHGLSVIVADEGASAGGQIYRQAVASPLADTSLLGADYAAGRSLIERFMACGAQYLPQTLVWQIEPAPNPVAMLTRRGAHAGTLQVHAEAVLLATGAQEGPWPVRGWTLPGVMGVGSAQATLKSAGLVPGADTVLAGSGQRAVAVAFRVPTSEGRPHDPRSRRYDAAGELASRAAPHAARIAGRRLSAQGCAHDARSASRGR